MPRFVFLMPLSLGERENRAAAPGQVFTPLLIVSGSMVILIEHSMCEVKRNQIKCKILRLCSA